jgi:hypothetical protein
MAAFFFAAVWASNEAAESVVNPSVFSFSSKRAFFAELLK